MNIIPIQDIWFDDTATFAMGEAFDHACKSLRNFGHAVTVREIIAKRIIEVAKKGDRDPIRLYEQALKALGIDEPVDAHNSAGSQPPAYALVALCA